MKSKNVEFLPEENIQGRDRYLVNIVNSLIKTENRVKTMIWTTELTDENSQTYVFLLHDLCLANCSAPCIDEYLITTYCN